MANHNTFVNNGFMGSEVIADTSAHTPTAPRLLWKGILVLNDAVFTTITGNMRNSSGLSGVTINAGTLIPGTFSTITLASGVVLALDDAT